MKCFSELHTGLYWGGHLNIPTLSTHGLMSQVFCIYMQNGSSDCGLYAVVFAISIAFGEDPTTLRFQPESMRQHLFKCLQAGKMEPFPRRKQHLVGGNRIKRTDRHSDLLKNVVMHGPMQRVR